MIDRTPQEDGRALERDVAEILGADLVPGSGAFFSKMDVRGKSVLWSLKHTSKDHVKVNRSLFDEVRQAIYGPGGIGGNNVAGVITRAADGTIIASFTLDDIANLLHSGQSVSSNRAHQPVDLSARKPSLLRDQGEDS